jgi:long-chain acyl-CoA synthetase
MRILFRLQVSGLENLPEDQPHVIAPNHESYLDAFVVAAALGNRRLRNVYWAGWTGAAFANPANRTVSRLARVVPVDPQKGAVSSLAFAAAVLGRKNNLVWFPEGRRSRTGELQPLRPGIGLFLDHFEPLVVPTRIEGTYEAMPVGKAIPRPVKVTVEFGKPIPAEDLREEGIGDTSSERIVNGLYETMANWEPN